MKLNREQMFDLHQQVYEKLQQRDVYRRLHYFCPLKIMQPQE